MAKKFNPNQLELDFFPAKDVAKINEAQIREFKRAYWARVPENPNWVSGEIHDAISDAFIERLAMDSATAKTSLRLMMRRSRHWNEQLQAWVIPIERRVRANNAKTAAIIRDMWRDQWTDELERAVRYFLPKGETKKRYIAAIERITGKRLNTATKKSKTFMQVSKAIGAYSAEHGSRYQQLEAVLFKNWVTHTERFTLYVSINPAHFLSMSNPKHDDRGDIVTSCHSFNGSDCYKSGCIGYARDDTSLIAFTAANNGDGLLNRKTARQIFAYRAGALLQSRLYTSSTGDAYGGVDEAASHWEYDVFLKAVCAEISRCEHLSKRPCDWETADYSSHQYYGYGGNHFRVIADCSGGFGGYRDWDAFADKIGMIRVSVHRSAQYEDLGVWRGHEDRIIIGAAGLSLKTGEPIRNYESILA